MRQMQLQDDIKENEEKINHHGKRADAIVKGMLQHSVQVAGAKRTNRYQCLMLMNICDWLIMVFGQKTNLSMYD